MLITGIIVNLRNSTTIFKIQYPKGTQDREKDIEVIRVNFTNSCSQDFKFKTVEERDEVFKEIESRLDN